MIASIVAAVGIAINFWNTGRQLAHDREKTKQQLEHDRTQKEAERALTLRREIYLGLAAHLQDGLFAVGDYANVELTDAEILTAWRKNAHFGAKLHLMGGGPLVKAYVTASQEINAVVAMVVAERGPLQQRRRHLEWLMDRINFHERARDKALETIQQFARDGTLNEGKQERLMQLAKDQQAARDQVARNHDRQLAEFTKARRTVYLRMQPELTRLHALLVAVAREARAELHEPFDESAYGEALDVAAKRTAEIVTAAARHAEELDAAVLGRLEKEDGR